MFDFGYIYYIYTYIHAYIYIYIYTIYIYYIYIAVPALCARAPPPSQRALVAIDARANGTRHAHKLVQFLDRRAARGEA